VNKSTIVSITRILTVIILSAVCIRAYPHLNQQSISVFIRDNSFMAPLLFIIICALKPVLFFVPSMGLTIVAGTLFGALWGTVYVAIGGAVSTVVGFYFARWLGRDWVEMVVKSNKTMSKLDAWSKRHGRNAVLLMRMCNMPWDIVSYWAGLAAVSFKDFYIASLIALLPTSFLYTYFGTQIFSPGNLGFSIALGIIIILGSLPYIVILRRKNTTDG
jgi:uncharacterized membrane protein YdjX (TVP38/TMEM64 family)